MAYPFVVIPFLAGGLGLNTLGVFLSHQAIALIFLSIINYGFNYSATKEAALKIAKGDGVAEIFSEVFSCKLYIAIACILLFFPLSVVSQTSWLLLISFSPMLIGTIIFPVWYFQATQRMHLIAAPHILSKLVSLILLYLFVRSSGDLFLAAFIVSGTYLFSGVVSMLAERGSENLSYRLISIRHAIRKLINDRHLAVGVILNGLYANFGLALAGAYASMPPNMLSAVGVGVKLRNGMPSIIQPIGQIIYPKASSYYGLKRKLPRWLYYAILIQTLVIVAFSIVLYLCRESLASILVGHSDPLSSSYIGFFALCGGVGLVKNLIFVQVLSVKSLDHFYSRFSMFQFPIFVFLMLSLTTVLSWGLAMVLAYLLTDMLIIAAGMFSLIKWGR